MSAYINDNRLPFRFTAPGIVAINANVFDWDTQDVAAPGLAVHVTALGATGVLTPEFSSDEVNWVSGWCEPTTLGATNQATITAVGLYNVPKLSRFVRLRMSTATTAGPTTISVTKSYADFRTATASGTTVVSGTVTSSNTAGPAAHDAAVSGNPVRSAGRAVTANYTAVASNDVADIVTTVVGVQVSKLYSIPEADWQFASAAAGIVNTTDVVARAAGAAGIRNYVTGLQLRNTNAVATEFVIKDGATVVWRSQLPASMTGSIDVQFHTPLRGTAATAINVQCVTTGAAVYANLQGYQAP